MCLPFPSALLATLFLSMAGCHTFAGNVDAQLRRGHRLLGIERKATPDERQKGKKAWVRVRSSREDRFDARVLTSRVQQAMTERGLRLVDSRSEADICLDLNLRYWGINPINDSAKSAFKKLVAGLSPAMILEGEKIQGGEIRLLSKVATPVEAFISWATAQVYEFNLIIDLRLRLRLHQASASTQKGTLVVYVRRIDLGEQEAAMEASKEVQRVLKRIF